MIVYVIRLFMYRAKCKKEKLEILFLIVGYTLRQKGSISTNDSSVISRFMHEIFKLDLEERVRVIECLNASKSSNFDIRLALHKFQHIKSEKTRNYIITTLIYIAVNAGGGELEDVIRRTIVQIAISLGYDESNINQKIDWDINIYAANAYKIVEQSGYHEDQDYDIRSELRKSKRRDYYSPYYYCLNSNFCWYRTDFY